MGLLQKYARALGLEGAAQAHAPAAAAPAPATPAPALPGGRLMNPVPARSPQDLYPGADWTQPAAPAADREAPAPAETDMVIRTQRRPGLAFSEYVPPSGPAGDAAPGVWTDQARGPG
jgi:hypothetical protein